MKPRSEPERDRHARDPLVRDRAMRDLRRAVHEIALDLLAIVWPCECLICGARDRMICGPCRDELRGREGTHRWVTAPAGGRVCVAGPFEGPLRALLVSFKHAGMTSAAPALGAQLRAPLRAALGDARSPMPLVVAVPSRPSRLRERGYHHVEVLIRYALRGWPGRGGPGDPRPLLIARALRAPLERTTQVGLSATERARNAALVNVPRHMRGRLRGKEVILVDDVVTTGATLRGSAEALAAAGAHVVAVVALCGTERRDRTRQSMPQLKNSEKVSHKWWK